MTPSCERPPGPVPLIDRRIRSRLGEAHSLEIVSCPRTIESIGSSGGNLIASNGAKSSPTFFIAYLWGHWKPKVVVFRRRNQVCAIVYGKERKLFGISTGIIYIDSGISSKVFARDRDFTPVLMEAIRELLRSRRIRGVRVTLPAESSDLVELRENAVRLGLDYDQTAAPRHRILPLCTTYESFLKSIGLKTRRHIRYYRRRYEADGHEYVENVSVADFLKAASDLMRDEIVGANQELVQRAAALSRLEEKPLLVGLRAADGKWLSVLAGWYEGGRAIVFQQANSDQRHSHYSLSSVLRSYLIESLIPRGITEIVFWGGVEGPLKRHSLPAPSTYVSLDKRDLVWKLFRGTLKQLSRVLPPGISDRFCWIIPSRAQPPEPIRNRDYPMVEDPA